MRVADYIFSVVESLGVRNVYGVTGRGSLFLSDAVARNSNLNWIALHHEQSAGFAALTEAVLGESLAVVVVSSGCASTNAITPLLNAWQDFVPLLFISGQHFSYETQYGSEKRVRTFGQQETNIIPIVKSLTLWSEMIMRKEDVENSLEEALLSMSNTRRAPAWIDIPLDIQSAHVDFPVKKRSFPLGNLKTNLGIKQVDLDYLCVNIESSERPLVLIGSGVRNSKCQEDLIKLCSSQDLPIVFANTAVDTFTSDCKFVVGSVGSMGCSHSAELALQKTDFLIVLGHRLGSYTTGNEKKQFAPLARICVIDIDFLDLDAFEVTVDRKITSDLKIALEQVNKNIKPRARESWLGDCLEFARIDESDFLEYQQSKEVDLHFLAGAMGELFSEDTVFVTDSGYSEVIIPTNIKLRGNQRFVHPASQGAMGFAIPAAVGVAMNSKGPVCVVVGDGSIMMNLQELQTISSLNLNVLIIVIKNDAYGIIRRRQSELFRGRTVGTHSSNGVSCPDFEKVAKAFNFKFERINHSNEMLDKLRNLNNSRILGPRIVEMPGFWNQTYRTL
jgi:acetolactate synthase-1/2/3 large subunit